MFSFFAARLTAFFNASGIDTRMRFVSGFFPCDVELLLLFFLSI
jgi:hypothetical protein